MLNYTQVLLKLLLGSPKMKKKINYLVLLLTSILVIGCTEVEDAAVTEEDQASQEITTTVIDENSEK